MAISRVKAKETEKLTPSNINKVIRALNSETPITKKAACEILNISYNTTRLDKIIQTHLEKQEQDKARRLAKRGTQVSNDEKVSIAERYLEGQDLLSISKALARSIPKIKAIIEELGIPKRSRATDYFKPQLIPDASARERFKVGEKVWSARYESMATVKDEYMHKSGEWVYSIWLEDERYQQYAYQPASELGSLDHLNAIGFK